MWYEWRDRRNVYKILMGRPEGRRTPERPRCRWGSYLNRSSRSGMERHGLD
jgi:hypothetical protein